MVAKKYIQDLYMNNKNKRITITSYMKISQHKYIYNIIPIFIVLEGAQIINHGIEMKGDKAKLLDILEMEESAFPFRYLGVPLHSKKLSDVDRKVGWIKITMKLIQWFSKLISFASTVELVKCLIEGVKN